MEKRIDSAKQIWDHFGPGWMAYRTLYALKMRSGWQRFRHPVTEWIKLPLSDCLGDQDLADPLTYWEWRKEEAPAFFFNDQDLAANRMLFENWDSESNTPIIEAEALQSGNLRYFRHQIGAVGMPPDWHKNPFTGTSYPSDAHWSRINEYAHGDIKIIWEASRFGFVYDLVRAYWRTLDERYAELFWNLVINWQLHNQPWQGPNWKCGQESSFRVMAWCFGLYGFLGAKAATPERVAILAQMIAFSGERIESNLDYALSQRNNHGISEGMGLWTIGTLFPEFKAAARWRQRGREILEELGQDLIAEDGSFVQHSVNYHRVMLHDYIWCLQLARVHEQPFSIELEEKIGLAGSWLSQMQIGENGRTPLYGQNDGALILPLNNCDYLDFRPVIQAVHYLTSQSRCYESGPWDEDLLWLFGRQALESPIQKLSQQDFQAEKGGYYVLHAKQSAAFIRCASFKDRPGQADNLHLDLWWQGQNIAVDPGTFAYNHEEPWNNPLSSTRYHNGVTVDGCDQMTRYGKYLWFPWIRGEREIFQKSPENTRTYWQGSHDGFTNLASPVYYRRGILCLAEDTWLIIDSLNGQADHSYRLHWLIADWPSQWDAEARALSLQTPRGAYHIHLGCIGREAEIKTVKGNENSVDGWLAPYYNFRRQAISLSVESLAKQALFWTLFSPHPYSVRSQDGLLYLENDSGTLSIHLHEPEKKSIVAEIIGSGNPDDRLRIQAD